MLDSEGETYERANSSFSGVNDLLTNSMAELAAAARMPVTVLFGQSPGGLGSNGDAETRAWHEQLEAHRRNVLTPAILEVARRFGVPPTAEVEWPLLWQPTAAEQAAVELQQAQADIAYVQAGIKTADEVREARGLEPLSGGYSESEIAAMAEGAVHAAEV
jgi:phage-related protein (TIGR01555 family)